MRHLLFICFLLSALVSVAESERSDLEIRYVPDQGYYVNVYDFSHEMKQFMAERSLHGGGPTWVVLLEVALRLDSPVIIGLIELDDESMAVQVRSNNKMAVTKVQGIAKRLMTDRDYLVKCLELADKAGHLE